MSSKKIRIEKLEASQESCYNIRNNANISYIFRKEIVREFIDPTPRRIPAC